PSFSPHSGGCEGMVKYPISMGFPLVVFHFYDASCCTREERAHTHHQFPALLKAEIWRERLIRNDRDVARSPGAERRGPEQILLLVRRGAPIGRGCRDMTAEFGRGMPTPARVVKH